MVILLVEHLTPSQRGELTRWFLEPRAGVFVGNVSAMVREKLWEALQKKAPKGGLTMIYSAKTEQGFAIRTVGDTTRTVLDFEGISLITRNDPNPIKH
jgi:CRISPR-associated protein Cas2